MTLAILSGHPWPTTLYLSLYLVTLAVHFVFMNYVVAGMIYTLACACSPRKETLNGPVVSLLRDWMPLMLGAAITAGVAPLLFVQILYQRQFYSANLLLFNRWMAVVPALIVAFYALYAVKSARYVTWPRFVRAGVALSSLVILGFVGWSWTENHLLSIHQSVWVEQFLDGRSFYINPTIGPRALFWLFNTLPTMTMIVAWQCRYHARHSSADASAGGRGLPILSICGLCMATAAAIVYGLAISADIRDMLLSSPAVYCVASLAAAILVEVSCWSWFCARRRTTRSMLCVIAGAALLRIFSIVGLRETIRLAHLDITELYGRHAAAAKVGGLGAFLVFFAINATLIVVCIWVVRRGWKEEKK